MRRPGGVVRNSDGGAAGAHGPRSECDGDGAIGAGCDAGAARGGLTEISGVGSRDGNAGDGERPRAGVGQGDTLSDAGGIDVLIAEAQGRGCQSDRRYPYTRTGKSDGLRRPGGAVRNSDGGAAGAHGPRSERDGDGAIGAGRDAGAAGVVLCKVGGVGSRDGNAGDGERPRAGVGQGDTLSDAGGIDVLIAEAQGRGCQSDRRYPYTRTGKSDGLRRPGGAVRNSDGGAAGAHGPRSERDGDGGIGAGRDAGAAGVVLCKVGGVGSRDGNAGDGERPRAGVGQGDTLSDAGGIDVLVAEAQGRGCQSDRGYPYTRTGKSDGLRRPGGAVRNSDGGVAGAHGPRSERDGDGAIGAGRDAGAAGVVLCKVGGVGSRDGNAGDGERPRAGVGQGDTLSGAGGIDVLIAEAQGRGCQSDRGYPYARAGKSDGLRRPGGAVRNSDGGAAGAHGPRSERDGDGAIGAGCDAGAAGVGLAKVGQIGPGDGDAGDGERTRAGVGQGDTLSDAGGIDVLVAETQGRGCQ